jgi:stage V sporulation protein B
LGFFFLVFFLLSGKFLGNFVFSNELAGSFIRTLSWICPFLYLNTTLNSILNGLGRTDITFFTGICGIFLRIAFIFFCIPSLGIQGYLFGLLCSQLFVTSFSCYFLHRSLKQF